MRTHKSYPTFPARTARLSLPSDVALVCSPTGASGTPPQEEVEGAGFVRRAGSVAQADKKTDRWATHPRRPAVKGGLSAFSLHGYGRAWKVFFHWCMRQGYLRRDPSDSLKLPFLPEQPPKAVLPTDLEHFLAATRHDPLDHALICFLADTGCRIGGLVNLRLADVNLEAGSALVREKGRGGQPQVRKVYMKPRTVQALRVYLENSLR